MNHDPYMHIADFKMYCECQEKASKEFTDQIAWTKKAIINVANIGKFSSDRTIKEYAKEIWNAKNIHINMKN